MRKIAILRGINVGGKRKILMADLKDMFHNLGFVDVSTYIQSGNVFFNHTEELNNIHCADEIQKAIFEAYGFEVPVIVISADEIKDIVESNPFCDSKDVDITKLHVTFLKNIPNAEDVLKSKSYNFEPDDFIIGKSVAYVYCEGKYHKSKLTNAFFEKKLKVTATTRNWRTVFKLLELSNDDKI